jgi:hypothetical protein
MCESSMPTPGQLGRSPATGKAESWMSEPVKDDAMDNKPSTPPAAAGSNVSPLTGAGPRSELHAGLRFSRPVALADLTEDLLWPKILKAPRLALRPASIGIALFALLATDLIGEISWFWRGSNQLRVGSLVSDEFLGGVRILLSQLRDGLLTGDPDRVVNGFVWLAALPKSLWQEFSWGVLLIIPMIAVLLIGGGAICRVAACEVAHGIRLSWVDALGFGLRKWRSLLLSILGPALLAGIIFAGIGVFGWLFFTYGFTQPVGALLYPVILLAGLLGAILVALTIVGAPLMAPAIACEGGDAIEGIQRAYAYVPSRPLRYALYLGVLTATGWVAVTLAMALGIGITRFNAAAIGWLAGDAPSVIADPAARSEGFTHYVLRLWVSLPTMLATAYAMSVVFTGLTIVYLLLRRVVDGQNLSDIWMPGLLPGTVATREPSTAPASDAADATND